MENEITAKRGRFLILVIATMVIFVGLVWLIVSNVPWRRLNSPASSPTVAPLRVEMNCTYPVAYWRQHPELYPVQIVLGNAVYPAKDIGVILSSAAQDMVARLQAQLVGAYLNIESGADQTPIETTIFQAYGWLEGHTGVNPIPASELEAGSRYYDTLQDYNLGLLGVLPCQGAAIYALTETSVVIGTATSPSMLTATQTITPSPSGTPTATGTSVSFVATATFKPLQPTATQTTEPPVVQPTNHPIVTEEPPPATWTPNPTATSTEKPIPTDTPIPTLPPPTPTLPIIPTLPN